jgi:peptide/nickel transport system permease protein
MLKYLVRRSSQMLPVLLIVTGLVFGLLWMFPGDPARAFVGPGESLDAQQLEAIRKEHHFDKPIIVQYGIWLNSAMRGQLGRSLQTNRSVADELYSRAQVTFGLGVIGILIAILVSLPAGIVAAIYRGRAADYAATLLSVGAIAVPGFWFGIMMILLFGVKLGWLPVHGYVALRDNPLQWFLHLLLPALSLGITSCALIMRQTRSAMLEVMTQDYVRTARAKGMSNAVIIWIHILPNTLLPVVTLVGLQVGHISQVQ